MLYTNNIYIPFIKDFHSEEMFLFYEKYYKNMGFNVKKINLDILGEINYFKIIEEMMKNDEEVFIFIDNLIIPEFAIRQAVELSVENKCLVIPTNKLYLINDDIQINNIIDSLNDDIVLNSFYYSKNYRYKVWPLDGAWVIHKDLFDTPIDNNESIDTPIAYDFDMCYKQYLFNNLIFIRSDSYKFNPNLADIDHNVLFIYKEYIKSLINIFGFTNSSQVFDNQILKEIPPDDCKNIIFNVDKYFSDMRYV
jgi:hypothetical protein